jgi:tetratricopeptide (TPR) repeat protein
LRAVDYYDQYTKQANQQARAAALQAIAIDPHFALAHAYVGWTYMAEFWWSWSDDPAQLVAKALEWAQEAVAADPQEYNAHWVLGDAYQDRGDPQRARSWPTRQRCRSIPTIRKRCPSRSRASREHMRAGLALGGLPAEKPGEGNLSTETESDRSMVR